MVGFASTGAFWVHSELGDFYTLVEYQISLNLNKRYAGYSQVIPSIPSIGIKKVETPQYLGM